MNTRYAFKVFAVEFVAKGIKGSQDLTKSRKFDL